MIISCFFSLIFYVLMFFQMWLFGKAIYYGGMCILQIEGASFQPFFGAAIGALVVGWIAHIVQGGAEDAGNWFIGKIVGLIGSLVSLVGALGIAACVIYGIYTIVRWCMGGSNYNAVIIYELAFEGVAFFLLMSSGSRLSSVCDTEIEIEPRFKDDFLETFKPDGNDDDDDKDEGPRTWKDDFRDGMEQGEYEFLRSTGHRW